MRLSWLLFLTVLRAESDVDGHSHVTVLTESIFDSFITSKPIALVQFYAPWCGHCQKLAPEYERAAKILAGEADLAKVDCTLNKQLCEKHNVKGFPTLSLFQSDGSHVAYEGERETGAIVQYMRKQIRPAHVLLNTEAELTEFRQRDFSAVAWLEQTAGPEYSALVAAANDLRNDCEFGVVTNPELFGGKTLPTLIVYKQFDEREVQFSSEWTRASLYNFIEQESFPLVGGIGPANYSKYVNRGLPILWLFLDPNSGTSASTVAVAEIVAKEFRGKVSTVALDGVRWSQHARSLGVQGVPGAVVQLTNKNENFVMSEVLSEPNLRNHLLGVLEGRLLSTLKSQDLPTKRDGNVTVLVGKNFELVTHDPTKTVFVMFFAPWCGHCKSMLPKWGDLADQFADNPDVIIAKLDVSANDVRISLQGVPTFMLFHAGTSSLYDGDRETAALHKFLTENLASPPAVREEL